MKRLLFAILLVILVFNFTSTMPVLADKVDLNLTKDEVAYTFFDLTHGEATLIQGNNNLAFLINTGHSESQEELKERLEMYNVDSIHTLILTSKEIEYIGNLPWLLNDFPIKSILLPESLQPMFESVLADYQGNVTYFRKGDSFPLLMMFK
ncbi:MAG: hypothetical protein LRY73_13080 [Bacillus sp. (in: Bacteria)]|nr:hypothetical protein [Bacillus sp. (in: firmicutes)]